MQHFSKQIYIISIFLFQLQLFGQFSFVSEEIKKIADSLKLKNIDTFIVIKNYCIGCYVGFTVRIDATEQEIYEASCEASDPTYMIFKHKNKIFIQKQNKCYKFKQIQVDSSNAFSYFINNFDKIRKEKIYTNASGIYSDGDTAFYILNHSSFTEYFFSLGKKKMKLTIDWTNFSEESHNGKKNIFYELNNSRKIKCLDDLLTNELNNQIYIKE